MGKYTVIFIILGILAYQFIFKDLLSLTGTTSTIVAAIFGGGFGFIGGVLDSKNKK